MGGILHHFETMGNIYLLGESSSQVLLGAVGLSIPSATHFLRVSFLVFTGMDQVVPPVGGVDGSQGSGDPRLGAFQEASLDG